MRKIPYEQIKQFIEVESNSGCKLLTKKDEYKNTGELINLLCRCGKEFKTTYGNFVSSNKRRCEICANKIKWNYNNIKYYIEVESDSGCKLITKENEYKNTSQKLIILCGCGKNHFMTSFENFKSKTKHKQYCDKCGKIKWTYEKAKEFVENNNCELITDNENYYNGSSWVDIKCNCGNIFPIRFHNFITGTKQCPECIISKGEKIIKEILIKYNLPYDLQYTFDNLRGLGGGLLKFDASVFCDREMTQLRMLIEYDGIFHYIKQYKDDGFEKLQIHDKIKNEYCKKYNIKLIRIPYWDFDNIESILSKELDIQSNQLNKLQKVS